MILNRMNARKRDNPIKPATGIVPCKHIDDIEFNSRCDELKEFYKSLKRFPHDSVINAGSREY